MKTVQLYFTCRNIADYFFGLGHGAGCHDYLYK